MQRTVQKLNNQARNKRGHFETECRILPVWKVIAPLRKNEIIFLLCISER